MDGLEQDSTPLAVQAKIAELIIDNVLVPMIVQGHAELDWVLQRIQTRTVEALVQTDEPKAVIGEHLQRSERWVYQQLELLDEERKQAAQPSITAAATEDRTGRAALADVLVELGERYPDALSVDELEERIHKRGRQVKRRSLVGILALSERLGLVQQVGGSARNRLYSGIRPLMELNLHRGVFDKLAERLSGLAELLYAYCADEGEFGGVFARLNPTALMRAREKLRDAVAKVLGEAIEETHRSEEPTAINVEVNAIFAIGKVGFSDVYQRKRRGGSY